MSEQKFNKSCGVFSDLSPDSPPNSPSSEIEDKPNLAPSTVQSQDVADPLHALPPVEMPAQPPRSHIVFNPYSEPISLSPISPIHQDSPEEMPAQPPRSHMVFQPYLESISQSPISLSPISLSPISPIHQDSREKMPAQPPRSHIVFNPRLRPFSVYVDSPEEMPAQPPRSHFVFNPRLRPFPIYVDSPEEMPAQPPRSHIVDDPCLAPLPVHQESSEELANRLSTLDFTEQPEVPLRIQRKDNKTLHKCTRNLRTGRVDLESRRNNPSNSSEFVRNRYLTNIIVPPGTGDTNRLLSGVDRSGRQGQKNDPEWDSTKGHPRLDDPLPVCKLRKEPQPPVELEDFSLELSWSDLHFCDTRISAARPHIEDLNHILHDFLDANRIPGSEDVNIIEEFPLDFAHRRPPAISYSLLIRYPDWDRRHLRRAQDMPVEEHRYVQHHISDDVQQMVFGVQLPASTAKPFTSAETTRQTNTQQMPSMTTSGPNLFVVRVSRPQSVEIQLNQPVEAAAQPFMTSIHGEISPPSTIFPQQRSRQQRVQRSLFVNDENEPPSQMRRRRRRRRHVRRPEPVEAVEPQPPALHIQQDMEPVQNFLPGCTTN